MVYNRGILNNQPTPPNGENEVEIGNSDDDSESKFVLESVQLDQTDDFALNRLFNDEISDLSDIENEAEISTTNESLAEQDPLVVSRNDTTDSPTLQNFIDVAENRAIGDGQADNNAENAETLGQSDENFNVQSVELSASRANQTIVDSAAAETNANQTASREHSNDIDEMELDAEIGGLIENPDEQDVNTIGRNEIVEASTSRENSSALQNDDTGNRAIVKRQAEKSEVLAEKTLKTADGKVHITKIFSDGMEMTSVLGQKLRVPYGPMNDLLSGNIPFHGNVCS